MSSRSQRDRFLSVRALSARVRLTLFGVLAFSVFAFSAITFSAVAFSGWGLSIASADEPTDTAKDSPKAGDAKGAEKQPEKDSEEDSEKAPPSKQSIVHARYEGFELTGIYQLFINRKHQTDARVYVSTMGQAILVLDSGFPDSSALIFDQAKKVLRTFSAKGNVLKSNRALDTVAIRGSVDFKGAGPIRFATKTIEAGVKSEGWSFVDNDKKISMRLRDSGHYIGLAGLDEVLAVGPQYNREADTYRRAVKQDTSLSQSLEKLKGVVTKIGADKINVAIYFGSWCSTCKQVLGKIVYLDRALTDISFTYYGLPQDGFRKDKEWIRNKLKHLPAGIVTVDGKEIGRAVSKDWGRPIDSMLNVLERYEPQAESKK